MSAIRKFMILASAAMAALAIIIADSPAAFAREAKAAMPAMPRLYTAPITHRADRVVVFKSQRKLVLMRGDQVLKIYDVALGRYPEGRKLKEGDGRTPEGVYTLDHRLPKSNFYKAIHISYPNAQDLARAQRAGVDPGGRIMIHGLPDDWDARALNHPALDWTQGCIAVTNREMDEIWRLVADGTTIEIHP